MHSQYVNFVRRSVRQGRRIEIDRASTIAPATQLGSLILCDLKCAIVRLPKEKRRMLRLVGIKVMKYHEALFVVIPSAQSVYFDVMY